MGALSLQLLILGGVRPLQQPLGILGGLLLLRGPQLTLGVGPRPLQLERGPRLTRGGALTVSAGCLPAAASTSSVQSGAHPGDRGREGQGGDRLLQGSDKTAQRRVGEGALRDDGQGTRGCRAAERLLGRTQDGVAGEAGSRQAGWGFWGGGWARLGEAHTQGPFTSWVASWGLSRGLIAEEGFARKGHVGKGPAVYMYPC